MRIHGKLTKPPTVKQKKRNGAVLVTGSTEKSALDCNP
jgi:hypothetical protein